MTLIKTGTGNSKHLPNKFRCPHCKTTLSINKRFFLTICNKCGESIKGDELEEIKD